MKTSSEKQFLARQSRKGFTLLEVMIAAGILASSLLFVFSFHIQAVRLNENAKKMTDCTYLAQTKMERLLMLRWTKGSQHADLKDAGGADPTTTAAPWAYLEHPNSSSAPPAVNASGTPSLTLGPRRYYVTWDAKMMDTKETWMRIRVRCQFKDTTFNTTKGTTISSYRFRDK
jgi:prepilin-type N-terminal cleavage/methylation domain-containing protein